MCSIHQFFPWAVIRLPSMMPAESVVACALYVCCSCGVRFVGWLAVLFDLKCNPQSSSAPWSQLLRRVSQRLAADGEARYLARFPWDLSNLSVLRVVAFGDAVECASVVEHLCCEAFKILYPDGRRPLSCVLGCSFSVLF